MATPSHTYRVPQQLLLSIVPEKSVGPLLPGTGPAGASHKKGATLIFRSLLSQLSVWLIALTTHGYAQTGSTLLLRDELVPDTSPVNLTDDGWTFDGMGTIASKELIHWGGWRGIVREQAVWLSDGSWIGGNVDVLGQEKLHVRSDWFRMPSMTLTQTRGLVLTPPASLSRWLRLYREITSTDGDRDVLWTRQGRRLEGVIRWPTEDGDTILSSLSLESEGRTIPLELEELQAIVFSPTLQDPIPADPKWLLGMRDGSRLRARSLSNRGANVRIELHSGMAIESYDAAEEFLSGCTLLAHEIESVQRLTAVEPASYRHIASNALQWELGVNRDLHGNPLVSSQGIIEHGLAMHSDSRVAYRWDGTPARFLAEVRLAPPPEVAPPGLGSVECRVLVARDNDLQPVTQFRLDRTAEHAVVQLDIDMTDAQLLVLLVEQAEHWQYGDEVFWLNPVIVEPHADAEAP